MAGDAQQLLGDRARIAGGLDGQAEDGVVERAVGVGGKVGIGVALDDR